MSATRRRPATRYPTIKVRHALTLWVVVVALALITTVWHVVGWLIATACLVGASYVVGRRAGRRRHTHPEPVARPRTDHSEPRPARSTTRRTRAPRDVDHSRVWIDEWPDRVWDLTGDEPKLREPGPG